MVTVPATVSFLAGDGGARFLPVAELDVSPDATGLDIARAVLAAHGRTLPDLDLMYGGLMVGLPDSEDGWSALEHALPAIVTSTGALDWQAYSPTVTFRDLQATAAAGLCERPEDGVVIILTGGSGGLGAAEWQHLLELLRTASDHLAYLGGVYAGVQTVRELAGGARKVIERAVAPIRRLAARNDPPDAARIGRLLERAPELRPATLSTGMELTDIELDDLLRLLGYERSDSAGLYGISGSDDDVVKLAELIYRHAKWSGIADDDELADTQRQLREAIDRIMMRISDGEPIPANPDMIWAPPE